VSRTTTFALTVLLAASAPSSSPPPTGNVYYVSTSGNDGVSCATARNIATPKRTIQNGRLCLQPGDTLYIRGGTYDERISDPETYGTTTKPVLIAGYPSDSRPVIKPTIGSDSYLLNISWTPDQTPRYLTIRYIEIDDINSTTKGACVFLGTPNITLDDVVLRNCSGNGIQMFSSNLWVKNSLIKDCGRIQLSSDADTKGLGFYIAPAVPQNSTSPDGSSSYARNNVFENNIVDGCRSGGGVIHYGRSDENIIRNNIFRNGGSYSRWNASNPQETGFFSATGVNIGGAGHYNPDMPRRNTVYNNLIYNMRNRDAGAGHFLWGSADNVIVNNTYFNVDVMIYKTCGTADAGHTIKNNLIATATDSPYRTFGTGCISDVTGTILNNLLNPDLSSTFVDSTNSNFTVKSESDAMISGAGATIPPS